MWHPSKSHQSSVKQPCCVTSIIGIFAILLYGLVLWASGAYKTQDKVYECNFIPAYIGIIRIFSKVDILVTSVLPYAMLPILNIVILVQLLIKSCSIQRYKDRSKRNRPNPKSRRMSRNIKRTKRQIKVTISLLCVSSVIWSLNVLVQWPAINDFLRFTSHEVDLTSKRKYRGSSRLLWAAAEHLYRTSFAVKPILYFLFSSLFRSSAQECCKTYKCLCAQDSDPEEVTPDCNAWEPGESPASCNGSTQDFSPVENQTNHMHCQDGSDRCTTPESDSAIEGNCINQNTNL